MSRLNDLIIKIDLYESTKNQMLILSTFMTNFRLRKDKTNGSGVQEKIDIARIFSVNNLTKEQLLWVKQCFYKKGNLQFNSYQFFIHPSNLSDIAAFVEMGIIFYKEKRVGQSFLIEDFRIIDADIHVQKLKLIQIGAIKYFFNKNSFYIFNDNKQATKKLKVQNKEGNLYIDLNNDKITGILSFTYGNNEFFYTDKNRITENIIRDFDFERNIFNILESNNWVYRRTKVFEFIGKRLKVSLAILQDVGINLFTSTKKKVYVSKVGNVSINYNMDWFEIKGTLETENESYDMSEILDLSKRHKSWIEIDNSLIFLPDVITENCEIITKTNNVIRIKKQFLTDVLDIAKNICGGKIRNIEKLINFDDIPLDVDNNLFSILRPYQQLGVKWLFYLHKNKFGGCLADDMGLGKTLQVITYLSSKDFSSSNNLIIVPKTLLLNWKKEFEKFCINEDVFVYYGIDRKENELSLHKIIITTYTIVINDYDAFREIKFKNIIVDEAQYIKNFRTKAYRMINMLKAETKLILTGTPIENSIKEIWGLMRLVNPKSFISYEKVFKDTDDENTIISNIKNRISPFILRRLKKDVLKDLPKKQEQIILCKMDKQQEELYITILRSIQNEINRQPKAFELKSNSIVLQGLLYLQQACCHPKLLSKELNINGCTESAKFEVLINLLEKLHENKRKIIVFSRFTKMLRIIENTLIKKKIAYFYLDGQTKNRIDLVEDFQNSENSVFLISLKAGGVGLNLTSADTAIIYDPWWNPAIEKQAEDRIYRIGQTNNVMIYRLITSNTIEEKIEELKSKKNYIVGKILENENEITEITMDVLRNLIFEN